MLEEELFRDRLILEAELFLEEQKLDAELFLLLARLLAELIPLSDAAPPESSLSPSHLQGHDIKRLLGVLLLILRILLGVYKGSYGWVLKYDLMSVPISSLYSFSRDSVHPFPSYPSIPASFNLFSFLLSVFLPPPPLYPFPSRPFLLRLLSAGQTRLA